jgi:hypothetical protein
LVKDKTHAIRTSVVVPEVDLEIQVERQVEVHGAIVPRRANDVPLCCCKLDAVVAEQGWESVVGRVLVPPQVPLTPTNAGKPTYKKGEGEVRKGEARGVHDVS